MAQPQLPAGPVVLRLRFWCCMLALLPWRPHSIPDQMLRGLQFRWEMRPCSLCCHRLAIRKIENSGGFIHMDLSGVTKGAQLLACATIAGILSVQAQAPDRATVTYGDWTAVCAQPAEGPKSCEMVHAQFTEARNDPVGQVSIVRGSKDE